MAPDSHRILITGDAGCDAGRVHGILAQHPDRYQLTYFDELDHALCASRQKMHELFFLDAAKANGGMRDALASILDLGIDAPGVVVLGARDDHAGADYLSDGACAYLVRNRIDPQILHHTIHFVNARRKLTNALAMSDLRYHQLLSAVTDYTYCVKIQDGRHSTSTHSRGCEAVTGYTPEEYAADSDLWHRMIHPADQEDVCALLERHFSHLSLEPLEHRIIHKNGSVRWISNTLVPRFDHHGSLMAYDGLVTDITGRKIAELALRESEERYRLLTENALDVISRIRTDGTILYASPSTRKQLGYASTELTGCNVSVVLCPEDRVLIKRAIVRALRSGEQGYAVQHRVVKEGGALIWMETLGRLVFGDNRQLHEIQCVTRDITDRKQAEELLAYQKALLQAQNETSLDGKIVLSPEGVVLSQNRRFCELWGITADAVRLSADEEIATHILEQVQDGPELQERMKQLRMNPDMTSSGELRLKDRRVIDYYSSPVNREDGYTYGRIWFYRDVTEKKLLEEQLMQTQKMECVGQLAAGIAHDFNNVLTAISGFSMLLARKAQDPSHVQEYAGEIGKCCERAADMIKGLMSFSRRQEMKPSLLDLNEIVREVEVMLRRLIGWNIHLSIASETARLPVLADKTQIEQVLMNLVTNARDAMPQGGNLTIETGFARSIRLDENIDSATRTGPHALLAVTDTGSGMDASTRQRIFEPFFTTKGPGKGTGLGLSSVYGIIKQHSGTVRVQSEPGAGTRFELYFPVVSEASWRSTV